MMFLYTKKIDMNWPRGYKSLLLLLISGLAAIPSQAQMKVGGQPGATRLDAALEIGSQKKGLLLPRVTNAALASNPLDSAAQGMMVFNIDDQTLYIKKANGYTAWNKVPDLSTYALSNLSDVNFSIAPTIDQLLRYNGTKWSSWTPNYIKTISGDVSAGAVDAAGNVVTTLANFGTAGTYFKTVVDAKGRVQSGETALIAADIPSLATSYIQNQTAALQAGTFRINGLGTLANLTVTSLNTQGGILFTNNTGAVAQKAAQLIWDNTNNRLGIGTGTPSVALHVTGDARVTNLNKTGGIVFTSGTTGLLEQDDAQLFWDAPNNRLGIGNAAPSTALHVTGGMRVTGLNTTGGLLFTTGTTGDVAQKTAQLIWDNTNDRLGIGLAAPAAKLDVEGTFKLGVGGTVLSGITKTFFTTTGNTNVGARVTQEVVWQLPVGTVLKIDDNVVVSPTGAMYSGLFIGWARVSNVANRQITVGFVNATATARNIVAQKFNIAIISL